MWPILDCIRILQWETQMAAELGIFKWDLISYIKKGVVKYDMTPELAKAAIEKWNSQ